MMLYLDSALYFSEYFHKHRSLQYFYCLSEVVIAISHPYIIDNLIFLQSYTILNQKSINEYVKAPITYLKTCFTYWGIL